MTRTLGYYGLETSNQLIRDMVETWGSSLQNIPEADTIWLLGKISDQYILVACDEDDEVSDEAYEVRNRLHQLTDDELVRLIQALVNKPLGKPIGYWMLSNENPLIEDITDTWGQSLEAISEIDRFWTIARCASHLWMNHNDDTVSDGAQEVFERIEVEEELSTSEMLALIQALASD